MSPSTPVLEEQYSKPVPDQSDQAGYQRTVNENQKDFVDEEQRTGIKMVPRAEDVMTWETEKEPDSGPGQGKSSGGKSQGGHHNQDRPGRMKE